MAEEFQLNERDVVLTNEFIYTPFMKELGLKCSFVFQEKFGAGEPSEAMIQTMYDAIPYDSYDRVIAVGGGGIPVVLENGKQFFGYGFGADKSAINEIVFNTSMVGYQEIVSDPSYTDQMVVMTYPLIGNYGMTDEDYETKIPTMGGLIVREYNDQPSNFRYTKTLGEV